MVWFLFVKIIWTLNSEFWLMISINTEDWVENWTERVSRAFCMSLLPPAPSPKKLNFELFIKKNLEKMKMNAWQLSCILLVWNTGFIPSCPVVYFLYNILCNSDKQNLFGTCHYTFKLTLLMASVWFCCCTGNTLPDLPLDFLSFSAVYQIRLRERFWFASRYLNSIILRRLLTALR